jgi:predicted GNAT family N-acyltransferase
MGYNIEHVVRLDSNEISEQLMDEIARLRFSVWNDLVSESTRNSPADWVDSLDARSEHYVIFDRDTVVGAARLSFHQSAASVPDIHAITSDVPDWSPSFPIASINRLVVSPQSRGKRAAKALDLTRINRARDFGAKHIIGLASRWRVPQLAQLDFEERGMILPSTHKYDELPLFLMQRNLA